METLISVRSTVKVCENIKEKRQEKTKQEVIKNLFDHYVNENIIVYNL